MAHSTLRLLTCLTIAAIPSSVLAQAASFSELPAHIKPGDHVSLTEADGRLTTGTVAGLSASSLTLVVHQEGQKEGQRETRSFPSTSVDKVVRLDGMKDGALKGMGYALLPAILHSMVMAKLCENEVGPCPGIIVGLGVLYALGGAGIGAVVDGAVNKTVYTSRGGGASLKISPVVGTNRQGMVISIGF